ncbi:unnamed protein product, partial [Symbiodinium sp. CCMP2456]
EDILEDELPEGKLLGLRLGVCIEEGSFRSPIFLAPTGSNRSELKMQVRWFPAGNALCPREPGPQGWMLPLPDRGSGHGILDGAITFELRAGRLGVAAAVFCEHRSPPAQEEAQGDITDVQELEDLDPEDFDIVIILIDAASSPGEIDHAETLKAWTTNCMFRQWAADASKREEETKELMAKLDDVAMRLEVPAAFRLCRSPDPCEVTWRIENWSGKQGFGPAAYVSKQLGLEGCPSMKLLVGLCPSPDSEDLVEPQPPSCRPLALQPLALFVGAAPGSSCRFSLQAGTRRCVFYHTFSFLEAFAGRRIFLSAAQDAVVEGDALEAETQHEVQGITPA